MTPLRSLLVAVALIRATSAACVADNCYNNLEHHNASDFCSTFTSTVNTALTGFPTYISTSCGYSRLSSACTCLYPAVATTSTLTSTSTSTSTPISTPTSTLILPCPTTVTTTATATLTVIATITATKTVTHVSTTTVTSLQPTCILRNGDFGLDPWVNEDIVNESSYGYNPPQIGSPGYESFSAVLVSFPAAGIYELDQYVTFPSTPISLTLTFYAMTTQPSSYCSIFAVFGARGGDYYAEMQFSLTSSYAPYSIQGTTDGYTLGFVALEVNCEGGTNNEVYIDDITLT